jgi:hypothetical protein
VTVTPFELNEAQQKMLSDVLAVGHGMTVLLSRATRGPLDERDRETALDLIKRWDAMWVGPKEGR